MDTDSKDIPVRVAIRIRPMVPREEREGCQECLEVVSNSNQIYLRNIDKAFTYDHAFPHNISQSEVYEKSVSNLVKQLFKGYNVTILAYGQTGSGKTYSMGSAYETFDDDDVVGIIPRAVSDIFTETSQQTDSDIIVRVSFVELYKECLYDLLNHKNRRETVVDIREDAKGGIKICGLIEVPVKSLEETMKLLEFGAMHRATGATAMNARSSRSHAIFSLHVECMNKKSDTLTSAKFHLVDLAGSERCKKTGATGERLKEGININKGLLSLGNVISALGMESTNKGHIPYRDSKLTRLLQDSLGGNSYTVMIACVSPADSNLEETLSTLRYADRARKIKNKPIVNRNPQEAELAKLKSQIQQLQVQLLASNIAPSGEQTSATEDEVKSLLKRNVALEIDNSKLTIALQSVIDENVNMAEKALMAESAREKLKTKLNELKAQTGDTVEQFNKTFDISINPQYEEQINLLKALQQRIIDLQSEQHKSHKQIMDHELARHTSDVVESDRKQESESDKENSMDESPIKGEFGASFTLRQAKLNEQLQDLNRNLAMKEELMDKITDNESTFISMRNKYEKNLKDLEDQINDLIIEKEGLHHQLKSTGQSSVTNKISEQRRKRLQELELHISSLKKKVMEQNKVLKIKEQSEQKVTKLNSEIYNMKAIRVKLMKQMKEDNEKFRKWKMQKDREVAKLKEQDRKKQFQMVKMERLHVKQQTVLKRKMEEAVAINKRLKDAMALQKDCQERRAAVNNTGSVQSRISSWLKGEIQLATIRNQAKISLPNLVDDRKRISDKIEKVEENLDSEFVTDDYRQILLERQQILKSELQMRSAQISDLQSKIVGADQEFDSKRRFDSMQSMIEAKLAAQYLFDVATENSTAVKARESDLEDLTNQYEETCQEMEELTESLNKLKEEHQREVNTISREHEEKILFLLGQLPKSGEQDAGFTMCDSELIERLNFQQTELEKLSALHEMLQRKTDECEALKKQVADTETVKEPDITFKKPVAKKKSKIIVDWEESDDDINKSEDDDDEDPDWRGTPLFRRIRQITKKSIAFKEDKISLNDNSPEKNANSTKRDSSGDVKCGCSRDCSSKVCKCRKYAGACTVSCKCNPLKCKNKITTSSTEAKADFNATFDFPPRTEPLIENQGKRIRLSKPKPSGTENFDPLKSGIPVFNISEARLPPH